MIPGEARITMTPVLIILDRRVVAQFKALRADVSWSGNPTQYRPSCYRMLTHPTTKVSAG